jgi:AcrR family transcriptional regulator
VISTDHQSAAPWAIRSFGRGARAAIAVLELCLPTTVDFQYDKAIAFVNDRWQNVGMSLLSEPVRKSDRTRTAILDAAQKLFSAQGYEGTSIRDVGALAAIDPSMVMRYFGSKEELFIRALAIDLHLPDLSSAKPAMIGDQLIRQFLNLYEGPDRNPGLMILLRSAPSNELAASRMREGFANQVLPTIRRVSNDNAAKRASLVSSQLLGIALCRYVVQLPPLATMSVGEIIATVGPALQQYVTGDWPKIPRAGKGETHSPTT